MQAGSGKTEQGGRGENGSHQKRFLSQHSEQQDAPPRPQKQAVAGVFFEYFAK